MHSNWALSNNILIIHMNKSSLNKKNALNSHVKQKNTEGSECCFTLKYILLSWFTVWDATVIQCGVRTSCETPWSVFTSIWFPEVVFFKPNMSEYLISNVVIERKISLQN